MVVVVATVLVGVSPANRENSSAPCSQRQRGGGGGEGWGSRGSGARGDEGWGSRGRGAGEDEGWGSGSLGGVQGHLGESSSATWHEREGKGVCVCYAEGRDPHAT